MDYAGYEEVVEEVDLAKVRNQAAALLAAEVAVTQAEEKLKAAKLEVVRISTEVLPELMGIAQLTELTMEGGVKLLLRDDVYASIRVGHEEEAVAYLESTGHEAIVKREIKIRFNKNETAWANKFERDCAQRKKPLAMTRRQTVHPETLKKWAREALEAGETIPEEPFSIIQRKVAKVKLPRR